MKIRRFPGLAPSLRGPSLLLPSRGTAIAFTPLATHRLAGSLSQRPDSKYVQFPGAVKSAFTNALSFEQPASHEAMPTYRAVDQNGHVVDSSFKPDLSDEEVIKLYRHMLLVSIMDIIMFDSQRQGRISFYMVSAGEEAVTVGSASALAKEDVVFCQYREQGVFAQRGFTPRDFMNQLFANKKDPGKGRNMPVHYGSRELNIHTISSPLATQIPHASGAAYALKMQHLHNPSSVPPRVAVVYFGEGAASEGDFHAALNIAATRSCPVIFICRNNGYSISTPVLEQYRGDGIASRGVGYGIETVRVDGNDIWAIREATKRAREMALQDGGRPVLIEALTYRVGHHSTSDDSFAYRARVEVEEWKRRDNPISRLRKWMEAKGIWDEAKEKEAREGIRRDLLKAFQEAEKEKKPPIRTMFEDVYEELTPEIKGQMAELRDLIERYPDEYDVNDFDGGKDSLK
ncbi:mitochondrial precursor/oxidoreductse activity protein [Cryphonectria parasitica EP155]|uniref:2-oxoisovalerate dehydrogenase subunit alpha n=1 Tax=Cryphonectria parasitica (strain ATCC 38755 / EP155) TaxID=660469 RepID=A0A9P5CK00_CRYP1|nr:mitochondrial precursor/oxidoreductse activity protein [Cryphonectria parasitica EP155]KAF3761764.1 mitochondrial precursor/oxidoreductse activity protein [Cryphonectria parasitica EP155]